MRNKIQCIIADPPYRFSDSLKMSDVARGAEANYRTMSISEIKALPIKELSDPDGAILALWVPSSLLQEGLDVMKAWGFEQKQSYIWVKVKKNPFLSLLEKISKLKTSILNITQIIDLIKSENLNDTLAFGMGRLFRQTHEICLIGINNKNIYKKLSNKSQRSVSFATNLKHSAKPEYLHQSLEIMFPNNENKVELFARRQRTGWYCLGNEAPMTKGEDIKTSLNKIITLNQEDMLTFKNLLLSDDTHQMLFEKWNQLIKN